MNHPVSMMQRARELTAAGFNPTDVGRILERETGRRVSRFTVRRWTNESVAEAKRAADRARNSHRRAAARAGRLGSERQTVIFQDQRARSLAEIGVAHSAVALAMDFDYPGQGWTVERVEALVGQARVEVAPPPAPVAPPKSRLAALERAAELSRKGWTWTAVAKAMTEYHGQSVRTGESWRSAALYVGLDVQRREMSPARREQLERLHTQMHPAAVAA